MKGIALAASMLAAMSVEAAELLLELDFEVDDGGLVASGERDLWHWG